MRLHIHGVCGVDNYLALHESSYEAAFAKAELQAGRPVLKLLLERDGPMLAQMLGLAAPATWRNRPDYLVPIVEGGVLRCQIVEVQGLSDADYLANLEMKKRYFDSFPGDWETRWHEGRESEPDRTESAQNWPQVAGSLIPEFTQHALHFFSEKGQNPTLDQIRTDPTPQVSGR